MSDHVYKKIELVGSSTEGLEPAIHNALARAAETVRHLSWFEVKEIRGQIQDGRTSQYQVTLAVGFRLDQD